MSKKEKKVFDEELAISVKLGIIYFGPISHLFECGSEGWSVLSTEIFNAKFLLV